MTTKKSLLILAFLYAFVLSASAQNKEPGEKPPVKKVQPSKVAAGSDAESKDPLKKIPQTADDYYKRGVVYADLKNYESAVEDYSKAIELNSEMALAYSGRADIKFIMQDFAQAITDFSKAIEMFEKQIEQSAKSSSVKYVLGDFKGSAQDNGLVGALTPQLAETYYKRGNAKQFSGEKDSSCEDLKKAAELGFLRAYNYIRKFCP